VAYQEKNEQLANAYQESAIDAHHEQRPVSVASVDTKDSRDSVDNMITERPSDCRKSDKFEQSLFTRSWIIVL